MKINEALHYFKQGYLNEWFYSTYIIALILTLDKLCFTFLLFNTLLSILYHTQERDIDWKGSKFVLVKIQTSVTEI